ncbi:MAG: hypothetical protein IBJ11_09595 [Phycisphaerales bacterium]|nr:hypothetical protein [Phycisphaerales bacterium]
MLSGLNFEHLPMTAEQRREGQEVLDRVRRRAFPPVWTRVWEWFVGSTLLKIAAVPVGAVPALALTIGLGWHPAVALIVCIGSVLAALQLSLSLARGQERRRLKTLIERLEQELAEGLIEVVTLRARAALAVPVGPWHMGRIDYLFQIGDGVYLAIPESAERPMGYAAEGPSRVPLELVQATLPVSQMPLRAGSRIDRFGPGRVLRGGRWEGFIARSSSDPYFRPLAEDDLPEELARELRRLFPPAGPDPA